MYGLKDLENVDYYCADCRAKSNYELSASEKCQPNVKYVYLICVCVCVCAILFPPVDFCGNCIFDFID